MHELRFWSYICQMLQDQFYPWFTHKRYVAHLTLKKCGSGASSQKWPTTDHCVHKLYMYTLTLSIILNSHVRSAKPPPPPFNKFLPDPKFELMVLCFHYNSRLYFTRLQGTACYLQCNKYRWKYLTS